MCAKLGKVWFVLLKQLTAESVSHLAVMNMWWYFINHGALLKYRTWTLWSTENVDECTEGTPQGGSRNYNQELERFVCWNLNIWSFYNVIFVENRHLLTTFGVFISLIWHLTCVEGCSTFHCIVIPPLGGAKVRALCLQFYIDWLQRGSLWSQCVFSFLKTETLKPFLLKKIIVKKDMIQLQ